jgi:ABC-type multidrug transport system ATPase subunit
MSGSADACQRLVKKLSICPKGSCCEKSPGSLVEQTGNLAGCGAFRGWRDARPGLAGGPRLRGALQLSSVPMPPASNQPVAPTVVVTGLVKQFGRFAALRGVSAEFASGHLYTILGDNGAGKTTLLRALAGLTPPTRGRISMLGTTNLRSVCGQLGYMAHPSLLYDEMSGMENLGYFARLYDVSNKDQRCAEVIGAVKLDPSLTRPVGQYSQGMRQRMSLARALLNDPKILLLDEPFSNVDLRSAREMVSLLTGLRDAGKTIFVVTHQASLLEGAADEFVWMETGQIVSRTSDLATRLETL